MGPLVRLQFVAALTVSADPISAGVDLSHDLHFDGDIDALRVGSAPKFAGPHVIFANFDGAQLSSGNHDSHTDTTGRGQCVGAFPAFGEDGPVRQSVLQATRSDWAAFNVTLTDDRPGSGNYTMVMVGDWGSCCGSGGVAPVICGTENLNAIAFSCQGVGSPLSAGAQAAVISQEAAHTMGLMHVNDSSEIMNPTISAGNDPAFKNECYSNYSPQVCQSQHTECPGGGQNTHAELVKMFGSAVPDTAAPTATVVSPADGESFEAGTSFEIQAEASDDVAIRDVRLTVNGEEFHAIGSPPFRWEVNSIPQGEYEVIVIATDTADNETTSAPIRVYAGVEPPPPSADSGGETGDGGETDGPDDPYAADTDPALPPGFGGDDETAAEVGCACRASPHRGEGTWTLALLFVAGAIRRRRT